MPGKRFNNCVTSSFHRTKCLNCEKDRLSTSKYCLECWVANPLKRKLRLPKEEISALVPLLIKKLEDSEYSCFYTGLQLVPGLNASIDHRNPRRKGGTNDISNLEWVHVSINNLKADRTEKQFIASYGSMLVEYNVLASKGVI